MNLHTFSNKLFHQFFLAYALIIGGIVMILLGFGSTIVSEFKYYKTKITGTEFYFEEEAAENIPETVNLFGGLIKRQQIPLTPVDEDFSIIIEKIGVNAPVIKNVSVSDEEEYFEALKKGVAHAKGKSLPGETGNVYMFAHSSIEFWKMGPYATVFNQVRRLEKGDKIHVVHNGIVYDYEIFDKKVVSGFDLKPFEAEYNAKSILTLQTCDPPGTTLNRLIVRSVLVD